MGKVTCEYFWGWTVANTETQQSTTSSQTSRERGFQEFSTIFWNFGDCQNTGFSYTKVPYLGNMEGNIVLVEEKTAV